VVCAIATPDKSSQNVAIRLAALFIAGPFRGIYPHVGFMREAVVTPINVLRDRSDLA
jgi:hypothetical protein